MTHPRSNYTRALLGAVVATTMAVAPRLTAAQECLIGEVRYFAGNYAPRNWAFANGQLLSITQYEAVFSILGTTYGGNGRTTFGLPDLRGRTPLGAGQGRGLQNYRLGSKGGVEQVTLDTNQLPSHTHSASTSVNVTVTAHAASTNADANSPAGAVWADGDRTELYSTGADDVTMSPAAVQSSSDATTTIGSAGRSAAFDNRAPYQVLHPIICLVGIYPSRN